MDDEPKECLLGKLGGSWDHKNVKRVLIVFRAEQRASIFITVVHVYHWISNKVPEKLQMFPKLN